MEVTKEFNLLFEPWILVVMENGDVEELSLLSTFERAHEIKRLAGELLTQDICILRLLLSVLYATYLEENNQGDPSEVDDPNEILNRWEELWNLGHFNYEQIEAYLKRYADRFYLFHPDKPFYQVNISKGTPHNASKLIGEISESDHKPRLFSTRSGKKKEQISYAEATRWLLYANSFDDASLKKYVIGRPSASVGWLGQLGLIAASGSNLFETLLLNFVLLDSDETTIKRGIALWESESVCSDERVEIPTPNNILALLTLQSRRLLLKRKNDKVVSYISLAGDKFPKENSLMEQMTIWSLNNKTGEYWPKRHDPSKSLWRDYSALVSKINGNRRPGVVNWRSILEDNDRLKLNNIAIFQTASVKYDGKSSSVEDVFCDSICVNAQVLKNLGDAWNIRIDEALIKTENCVQHLGYFMMDLLKLSVSESEQDKEYCRRAAESIRGRAYYSLDLPFRMWIQSIDPSKSDMEDVIKKWQDIMKSTVIAIAEEQLRESGKKAIVGKSMSDNAICKFGSFKNEVENELRGVRK